MSVYRKVSLSKYDCKNVIYLAYIGVHHGIATYKYGKSTNVYNREMTSHRKTFAPTFEMKGIYETNYKDQVETLLEKELKIRNLHRAMEFNNKRQTELFVTDTDYTFLYVENLVKDIIHDFDVMDDRKLKIELEKLQIERLRLEILKLETIEAIGSKKMSCNIK